MERIVANALRLGRRPALYHADGRALCYADLVLADAQLAAALGRDAPSPGCSPRRVAVPADDRLRFAQLLVSLWARGHSAVPLDTAALPPAELARRAAHVRAPALADERLLLFTSGTTSGRAKGVVHTHRSLSVQLDALAAAWRWTPADVLLLALPLTHIHGLVTGLLAALATGAAVRVHERFSPRAFWSALAPLQAPARAQAQGAPAPTVYTAVPTMYAQALAHFDSGLSAEEQRAAAAGARRLRLAVSGSAALEPSVYLRWRELGRAAEPGTAGSGTCPLPPILERYGSTEAGIVLANLYEPADARAAGSVGAPIAEGSVRCRVSPDGELLLCGPTLFSAYSRTLDDGTVGTTLVNHSGESIGDRIDSGESIDDRTGSRTKSPIDDADESWFRTGDLVEVTDGRYRILGRTDDVIAVAGTKVSPVPVEQAVLLAMRDRIDECAAVGVPDRVYGRALRLVLVPRRDTPAPALAEIRSRIRDTLPGPEHLPTQLTVLASGSQLPRNALGKLDRRALVAAAAG